MRFTSYCDQYVSIKLTDLRCSILHILWQSKKPMSAYDILEELRQERENAKPATVYRVLDVLLKHHVVHKIATIQAYSLCIDPSAKQDADVILICRHCQRITEVMDPVMFAVIEKLSQDQHYAQPSHSVEVQATCHKCHKQQQSS